MIFAGDFAQLPPVIGAENAALYRPDNGMYATNKKSQEAALGKAIWHQVTTVVILRQNMRQNMQSTNDASMRTALSNMRYKMCTAADIAFRNVSIITGLNVHKDEFNRIGSSRFSVETGQVLTDFYSDDTISEAPTTTARSRKKHNTRGLSARMQRLLWEARPSDNNKHISGKLSLCKGFPVTLLVSKVSPPPQLCGSETCGGNCRSELQKGKADERHLHKQ
ncbi:hypothetical protein F5146DRAFT_920415 [Armillaria mellea]|nr:hypothetical protein F5146DRAFT_920415 [Armillaria mellea]